MTKEQELFNQKLSDINTKSLYVYKCGVHQPMLDGFNYFQISLEDAKKYIEYITQLYRDLGDGENESIWFERDNNFEVSINSIYDITTTEEHRKIITELYVKCYINEKPYYCDDILYLVSKIMKNKEELSYLKYRDYGVYYESYDDFWFFTFNKEDLNKIIPPFFLQD